uniref:inositol monophosphatase family protein n=1 Tax=Pararhizobium sp. IMCC3301 TaxID=3067904 RepID=UPI002742127D|nr:inositol monophosphatase family protein [Pararhizobium sp. IMCC3301]
MNDMMTEALRISAAACAIPKRYFRSSLSIDQKSDESPVTIVDRETEEFLRRELLAQFPDHGIFGEEFGRQSGDSAYEWIIDPIDGTRSFISGNPLYGMLLALLRNSEPVFGIVRMPELEEVYTGTSGTAFRNGTEPLAVSQTRDLSDAAIYINEGEKIHAAHPALFQRLCKTGQLRRFAYDCYPHMLLAAGHIDAVIDFDLQPYDYLPLVCVVKGAGGIMTDWQGENLTLRSDGRVISAATPELHKTLLELVQAG